MDIVKCGTCGKKYGYELVGTVYPGGKERETAYCPYCGAEGPSEMTSQFIHVSKLDENDKLLGPDCKKNVKDSF